MSVFCTPGLLEKFLPSFRLLEGRASGPHFNCTNLDFQKGRGSQEDGRANFRAWREGRYRGSGRLVRVKGLPRLSGWLCGLAGRRVRTRTPRGHLHSSRRNMPIDIRGIPRGASKVPRAC